jgi:hypothetical protein
MLKQSYRNKRVLLIANDMLAYIAVIGQSDGRGLFLTIILSSTQSPADL